MKQNLLVILTFIFLTHTASVAFSQNNFTGTWQGTLNAGVQLRLVLNVKQEPDGSFSSAFDSPDQGAFDIKCDSTIIVNSELKFSVNKAHISYTGKMINDSTITGIFTQGATLPLDLKRRTKNDKIESTKKPQTPEPPFPYKSEDVEYDNADKTMHYGATITIPNGTGPFPATVMISGSGLQDRDETIGMHKPFAVIADHLTRNGFIVLRVDDQGIGKSTGDPLKATSADFAKDVNTSIDYLKTYSQVNKNRIGLIGHSEGGMIAPMVANSRDDVDFIVLLAAPGVKIKELLAEQNTAVRISSGVSKEAADAYNSEYLDIEEKILNAPDSATAYTSALNSLNKWSFNTQAKILTELNFANETDRQEYIKNMINTFNKPWFKYFINYDPALNLEKLQCKVLALNGSRDIQVNSKQNLPAIEAALKKSESKLYEVREVPELNHLFQTCNKCTIPEYMQLEETFSSLALQIITAWLVKYEK